VVTVGICNTDPRVEETFLNSCPRLYGDSLGKCMPQAQPAGASSIQPRCVGSYSRVVSLAWTTSSFTNVEVRVRVI
jgi:hypothetical protein